MKLPELEIREIEKKDIESIADYWLLSDPIFMEGMGVNLDKMPVREEWNDMLLEQINTPLKEKKSFCMIWLVDDVAIGHSNINKIIWGQEAFIHLHIWKPEIRKKGYGTEFIRLSALHFFKKFQLQKLYCEPYALNEAPNKTLANAGFQLVKEYITTPGWINFEQPVKLWVMHAG